MISEVLVLIAFLIENCTGVVLIEKNRDSSIQSTAQLEQPLLNTASLNPLEDFIEFDPEDAVFQEYDPPQYLKTEPKGWKLSLPAFKTSLLECLKTVLVIQTVAGTLIGIVAIGIVFLDFSTVSWCYNDTSNWYKMPKSVQHLRVIALCVEDFFIQSWVFFCICVVFPMSLIKELNLVTIFLTGALLSIIYRLNLQMFGVFQVSWKSFPLNGLFILLLIINHCILARHFYPNSLRNKMILFFILSAQFLLGLPVAYFLVYRLFYVYIEQDEHIKVIIAGVCPLLTAMPKVVCRLAAQSLNEIVHPGAAHVFAAVIYGASAIVFRVMQAELTSIGLFIALGLAHALIDLLERITITMRDYIWEYLHRLVRRQRSRPPKYRTPRSRRLIADVSIQIMMQESSALITALGFITIYQAMYSEPKPFINSQLIIDFFHNIYIIVLFLAFCNEFKSSTFTTKY